LIFSLGSLSFADASETAVTAKGQPPCLMLPVGSVQPRGWMLAQLEADLAGGVTGRAQVQDIGNADGSGHR
jgi:hypothetical protein